MKVLRYILIYIMSFIALDSWAVETIEIASANVPSPAKCIVAVPKGIASDAKVPVVVLLHGYDGDYTNWSKRVDLDSLATAYNVIIVCPNGFNSWYFDYVTHSGMNMESFIIDDLIPYIDATYPVYNTREERAITGLSMGGHGALWLAMRHPDIFSAASGISGAFDIERLKGKFSIADALGPYRGNESIWKSHSVLSLAGNYTPEKSMFIAVDCGEEDYFFKDNIKLHKILTSRKINHTFIHQKGNHSWKYWVEELPKHLDMFKKWFREEQLPE